MEQITKLNTSYILTCEVSFEDARRLAEIAVKCDKITAIWCARRMYNIRLKEAKDFIDSLVST